MARSLQVISKEIKDDWKAKGKGFANAAPYRDAMQHLSTMSDSYHADSAKTIVLYFLANASTWTGETARRIKIELRGMAERA